MEEKLESEIAKRVAGKNGREPSKKVGVLLAVAVAFALLAGTAAYGLAAAPTITGTPPMTEYVLFDRAQDKYIADDDTTAALRVMTLKVKGDHDTAGEYCMLQDAKFNYMLRVAIYDASIDWTDMQLGELTLPVGYTVDSMNAYVFDSDLGVVNLDTTVAFMTTDESGVISVVLPTLADEAAYGEGYIVSITIVLGTTADLSDDLSGLSVTEVAWGDDTTLKSVEIP
ncbi:MAG TPA: hypothetical protein VMW71_02045 [Thermoplasmata archaeon]|nr:hypothetical protein [Thermoplasmata archaeon]